MSKLILILDVEIENRELITSLLVFLLTYIHRVHELLNEITFLHSPSPLPTINQMKGNTILHVFVLIEEMSTYLDGVLVLPLK